MLIIKEGDWIFEDCYQGLLSSVPDYKFKHDAIAMSRKEAEDLWKALTKRPIECDSENEVFAIQAAVQELKKCLAAINHDAVKENHGEKKDHDGADNKPV